MSQGHLLIVAVDGLRASALGAYGNTSVPTPALNQFAAESLLFDQSFAPAAELGAIYRAMWSSRHPLRDAGRDGRERTLPRILRQSGYETTLVSDDSQVSSFATAKEFDQQVACETEGGNVESAPLLVRTFATASEIVAEASRRETPQLVWVHVKGLYGPWEAPIELQQRLLDEGDPPPVTERNPPDFVIDDHHDADLIFRFASAYAAQIMLLDECWSGLMETMRATGREDRWLTMLIGARGFPLGEHQHVGGIDDRLYAEQLHVPWLVRFPDRRGQLSRCSRLVSHLDVLPTIEEWLGARAGQESKIDTVYDGMSVLPWSGRAAQPGRGDLLSIGDRAQLLQTSDWSLRFHVVDGERPTEHELYVRPDDRWQANDVAARCPDVVARLAEMASGLADRIRRGEPMHVWRECRGLNDQPARS
jgi:arylsulfatase A-like enzyme